jgi:hypothetical protein
MSLLVVADAVAPAPFTLGREAGMHIVTSTEPALGASPD